MASSPSIRTIAVSFLRSKATKGPINARAVHVLRHLHRSIIAASLKFRKLKINELKRRSAPILEKGTTPNENMIRRAASVKPERPIKPTLSESARASNLGEAINRSPCQETR